MNVRILGAILKKDVLSLLPLVSCCALLIAGDVVVTQLELSPPWLMFRVPVLLIACTLLVFAVFQLDAPASLVDDWLCRPVPRLELLTAKVVLVFAVTWLTRAVAMLVTDLAQGMGFGESLKEALLLPDSWLIVVVPLLLITAAVTRTIVQGFGVMIALFVCVFMIPTPLVQAPDPLSPAIGEALITAGFEWLVLAPAKVMGMLFVGLAWWLVYWRRRLLPARVLLAVASVLMIFSILLPIWLLPWQSVERLQSALSGVGAADPNLRARIELRNPQPCFPATRSGDLANDAAFNAARAGRGLRAWTNEDLRDTGPDSLTFLTGVELRKLPLDTRAKLAYVQADYMVDDAPQYSLRPAMYITDQRGNNLVSHAWVLPAPAWRRLEAETGVSLRLSYWFALLEPREFHVPADGRRHELPGFGSCRADIDASGDAVAVDCFTASGAHAQVSAELRDIPATRVYSPPNFAPAWARAAHSERVSLSIGSPRLAPEASVTVTVWYATAWLDESLTVPGILGGDRATCPLPTRDKTFQQTRWRDTAAHESESIAVDEGVQLEVLDFGGEGPPILLLPGLGATAHSFDDLAPQLARKHRVVAMTRRGTGFSSRPDFGYDTPRLAQDVLRVMDALDLDKVVLVGASIAGDELTWLGGHHADRFHALVYLDAAYDRSGDRGAPSAARLRELNRLLPPQPPLPPQSLRNYEAMLQLLAERGHSKIPEGELIALHRVNEPWSAGTPNIDSRTMQAISAGIRAPDYSRVKLPALAIYALADPDAPLPPWYDANDAQLRAALAERARLTQAMQRASIEQFRRDVANGQVIEVPNAMHAIYLSNPREVLEAIEKFVGAMPAG